VLIVLGHPVARASGTGVTLGNLFREWPQDRLAQVHLQPPSGDDYCVFASHFALAPQWLPLDYLIRTAVRQLGKGLLQGAPENSATPLSTGRHQSLNARLHLQARAAADLSPLFLPPSLKRWVSDFRPDILYTHLGSIRIMRLANGLARIGNYPVVPHFMDDWLGSMYTDGPLFGFARHSLLSEFKRIIKRSPGGLCISPSMAQEYKGRYGLPCADFMNCLEDDWFSSGGIRQLPAVPRPLRIVYCGGLHLGRDKVLVRLAEAIQSVNSQHKLAELHVFAPAPDIRQHASSFTKLACVRLGSLGVDDVRTELMSSGVNVHVESFEPENIIYTRYSISTKIPQYLACGKAILAIGPAELASMEHLRCSGGAAVVNSLGVDSIANEIAQLLNPARRQALGCQGRAYAVARHSAATVRIAFRNTLLGFVAAPGKETSRIGHVESI